MAVPPTPIPGPESRRHWYGRLSIEANPVDDRPHPDLHFSVRLLGRKIAFWKKDRRHVRPTPELRGPR